MEEEKEKTGFNKFLDNADNKAEQGGKKTLWQIVKFIIVSSLVTLIQLGLVNLLYFLMKSWTVPLPDFLSIVFSEKTIGECHSNWGYILPFFISNLIANTVGYFLNKSKTFKSDAPMWHYIIYILFLLILIVFSTWLQGIIANAISSIGAEAVAPTIAGMVAGTFQMIVLFPLQKFVLLREKKKE